MYKEKVRKFKCYYCSDCKLYAGSETKTIHGRRIYVNLPEHSYVQFCIHPIIFIVSKNIACQMIVKHRCTRGTNEIK